jgi:hypothetical protein
MRLRTPARTVYWLVVKATSSPNDRANYARWYYKAGATRRNDPLTRLHGLTTLHSIQIKFTAYK